MITAKITCTVREEADFSGLGKTTHYSSNRRGKDHEREAWDKAAGPRGASIC